MPEGGKVKIAKLGNPRFVAEVQRLQKPHLTMLRSGLDCSKIVDEITIKAMAKAIVLDWEGFELDGETFQYNQENAEMILREFSPLREFVSQVSSENNSFQLEDVVKK